MAVAETANLLVKLSLGGNFQSQIGKATSSLKGFDRSASRSYKAGTQIGTGIKRGALLAAAGVGVLVTQIGFGLDQLIQLESLTAQTNAVLKSTGNAAGQTADSIRNLAEKYESLNATIDDKVIQSGENLLLTFTAVRKKAFEPALAAALDLSVALHTDLNSAIKVVGKALSDPAKAVALLTRKGIILTKSEQKQIAAHLKNNDALGAQNVILAALNKRYSGSFLAGGQTTAGKVAKFGDAIEDIQKTLAVALLPTVTHLADALDELFRDPATIEAAKQLGEDIGKIFSKENIDKGIGALKDFMGALKAIAGPIAEIVGTAVKAFTSLPPDVQKLLVGGFAVNKLTGGLVTNVFGGIAEAIAKSFIKAPLVNVTGGVVNVNGGIGGGGLPGQVAGAAGGLSLGAVVLGVGAAAALGGAAGGAIATAVTGAIDPTGLAQAQKGQSLGNRDPRRFDQYGRVIANYTSELPKIAGQQATGGDIESLRSAISKGLHPQAPKTPKVADAIQKTAAQRDAETSAAIARLNLATGPDIETVRGAVASGLTTTSATIGGDIETMRGSIANGLTTNAATVGGDVISSAAGVSGTVAGGAARVAGQTAASGSAIVGAIYANRPITNVDIKISGASVSHSVTVATRYGPTGGDRNTSSGGDKWNNQ